MKRIVVQSEARRMDLDLFFDTLTVVMYIRYHPNKGMVTIVATNQANRLLNLHSPPLSFLLQEYLGVEKVKS